LANLDVNGSGAVMASPSHSNPNYYYHWQRDAAISMDVLQHSGKTPSQYDELMRNYVGWIHQAQTKSDNNCDVRGEPKFMLDGTGDAYPGGWMRPQNDGSALRTVATVNYGIRLFNAGNTLAANSLYPAIQNDLAYVTDQWDKPSGDLWEEVKGDLFFTKMCQRKGLLWGAKFATLLGKSADATAYTATAKTMESSIESHWEPNSKYGAIYAELKETREMDSAIHLGILYGLSGDGFIAPSTDKAQSSVANYLKSMTSDSYSFAINKIDDAAGIPGVLTGRYPQDHYQGSNPWILTTQAVGRFYYLNAQELVEARAVNVTALNHGFFQQVIAHAKQFKTFTSHFAAEGHVAKLEAVLQPGTILAHDMQPELFTSLMRLLVSRGDGQLLRVKHHIKALDFHMPEQLAGSDGSSVSAVDLTWSYGTAIAALTDRKAAMEAILRLP
jgi:glucoamylase